MLKLYSVPISLYCAKTRILLRHKQLEFDEIPPPGGYGSTEYKRLVPAGSLPALEHDGFLISDSEAIAEYLNEAFPIPDMLPGTLHERAKHRELSRFHDTRLEPALRALFPFLTANKSSEPEIEGLWKSLQERLDQITPLLSDRTKSLTIADCGLIVTGTWIELVAQYFQRENPLDGPVSEYLNQLRKYTAVAAELAIYSPRLVSWLASK